MTATLTPPAGMPAHWCAARHRTVMGSQDDCRACGPWPKSPPPKKKAA